MDRITHEFNFGSADENANSMDSEAIMKEIRHLYNAKEVGLREASKSIRGSAPIMKSPQQKITVLLAGSHYAAKEKFLNLYFNGAQEEDELTSKVNNYENHDRIFITNGIRPRKCLTGVKVLDCCPHLAKLGYVPGLKDYLTTEIAAEKTKSLVSFIVAPENVDTLHHEVASDMNNIHVILPVMIEKPMKALVEAADLVFIFFDPTGRTPPSQILKPFDDLWEYHHHKMHLLLAKANEIPLETTLTQIVQQVWRHPQIQRLGCTPKVFCPDLSGRVLGEDEQLWNIIKEDANKCTEQALHQLGKDATYIENELTDQLEKKRKSFGILKVALVCFWVGILCACHFDFLSVNSGLFVATFCSLSPVFLSRLDKELLKRRIRFAHNALCWKESIQKPVPKLSKPE
ncbi:hypothetical protein Ocin01_07730 [Orchesella cincta]|uniref:Uncharacterized protein n=1 Tax=Orchesella cincta TaxID=48709 RepID=A0A1D2N147_ORCCI|nr:hypothetical protein Ocin01_07730 [Orchesella cincta]